ncbi:MAG: hypothetical protein A2166_00305 [Omnitrophica WOR_2 bacterium RBG_13_41_10]|nr:MAG: hypothetical protein A2166_00305 [Omnitrophica WOR_2 bacterium RBG_13_41_10]
MKKLILVLALGLVLGLSTFAWAGLTPISSTYSEDGPSWILINSGGILDTLFGWGNLTRIDDDNDQLWNLAGYYAIELAKIAGYSQSLSAGSQLLFTDSGGSGWRYGPGVVITEAGTFKFYNDPNNSGSPWSSDPLENSDQGDHMVAWQITGNAGYPNNYIGDYVVGWEDKPLAIADCDYNDLVVLFHVPEPTSMMLLGMGILGLFGLRRKPA